ncbi:TldD/PmbA family protein [bacterium]|nr:TldD/PmbA family protein [candidate division CSSED10-310 bacterium]
MMLNDEIARIRTMQDPVELLVSHRYLREINFQDNQLKDIQSREVSGKAVRIIHSGRVGAAPGGLQTPVDRLIDTARDLSSLGRIAAFTLPEGDGRIQEASYMDPLVPDIDLERARDLAVTIIDRLQNRLPAWVIGGGITLGHAVNRLVTSRGIDQHYEEKSAGFHILVTLPREGDLLEVVVGRSRFPDATDLDGILDELTWRARQAETVADMPSGTYPVLFHPEALSGFLSAFEQAINGRMVFDGVSPLINRIGKPIFNPRITLIDDPTDPTLAGYAPFGDEGTAARPITLVENGILQSYLTDLDYAARLGCTHTGHGSRFPGSLDEGRPSGETGIDETNWILSAGDTPVDDMLASISDGIYLLASWDVWSGNIIGGDVSGSTHLAYRIRNGHPVGRIKDMRISGNLYQMLGDQLQTMSRERPDTSAGDLRVPFLLVDGVTLA